MKLARQLNIDVNLLSNNYTCMAISLGLVCYQMQWTNLVFHALYVVHVRPPLGYHYCMYKLALSGDIFTALRDPSNFVLALTFQAQMIHPVNRSVLYRYHQLSLLHYIPPNLHSDAHFLHWIWYTGKNSLWFIINFILICLETICERESKAKSQKRKKTSGDVKIYPAGVISGISPLKTALYIGLPYVTNLYMPWTLQQKKLLPQLNL